MAFLKYRTKGNSYPKGKPRVYFTCHPDDFKSTFDRICEDIFVSSNCAIYYTEDMAQPITDENRDVDLGQMNLFVVPITFKLLTKPNRAMNVDIKFAKERNIPILPIMMEYGIDDLYSHPDKFGSRQYLNALSHDETEISYAEKLEKYLESTLVSDKTASRIRAAFDAYIFLSYRKKDRRYANELMRLIHKNPECRDIAIWYDEFLTPGESFDSSISKALEDSKLFALLVTPNLLEEPNGKPNFVMKEEYPAAVLAGKEIIPAEMVKTDRNELSAKFSRIPDCVDPNEDKQFRERLVGTLKRLAITANDRDPEHNFLVGLAYLDGIDVERDTDRALSLIISAANDDLPEAMDKLYGMYNNGISVGWDYKEALKWGEMLADHQAKALGDEHADTLDVLARLAKTYGDSGDHAKEMELKSKVYECRLKALGEEHPKTISALGALAVAYDELGDYKKAIELYERVYESRRKTLGDEDPDVLTGMHNLARGHIRIGNYSRAVELGEAVYSQRCRVLGEENPQTLTSLNDLALAYSNLGNKEKAGELTRKAYEQRCKASGEEHPHTLTALNNLAQHYNEVREYEKALELGERAYQIRCRVLGEEHPLTLTSLSVAASACGNLKQYQKAFDLKEKVYKLRRAILGEDHPDTLIALGNLACAYSDIGNSSKSIELFEAVYEKRSSIIGEEHPYTVHALTQIIHILVKIGDYAKLLRFAEKLYDIRRRTCGEEHPYTLSALGDVAHVYTKLCNYQKAVEIGEKVCEARYKVTGEEHLHTAYAVYNLAIALYHVGNYQRAEEKMKKALLIYSKLFGNDHSNTRMAAKNLEAIRRKLDSK